MTWLAACGGGAIVLIVIPGHFARAASLGLATGLLFADGDISAKLVGYGGLGPPGPATLLLSPAVGARALWSASPPADPRTAGRTPTRRTRTRPAGARRAPIR